MPEKDFSRVVAAFDTAHGTEVTGYFFYKAAADMLENERGKNVFTHLAKEELDHIKAISAMAESLKEGSGWITYEKAVRQGAPKADKGLPIYPEKNELLKRFETNQTDLNAVSIAIEAEDEAIGFYSNLLAQAECPEEKVVFTKLLEMEKAHLKVLRWESESLNTTGFWGDNMEFSVEKEAD